MKKLGIYVQVPFCQTKCTYCNFHTGVVAKERFAPYVDAVCREIQAHEKLLAGAGVSWGSGEWRVASGENEETADFADTVYFGGGTPSLLEPGELGKILEAIREAFETELVEVTLEADPETVEEEKAAAWARAGINRVSFGVQSFSDKELKAAGRMHRRTHIYRAVPILRKAGIRNISFDLIAGLPHQTEGSWKQSLEELIALAPEHVSVYLLEVDEGSRLGKELLAGGARYSAEAVPSEDAMAEFYEMAQTALSAAGYRHYEISNWAKPGFESKHNLKYWRREPYLGFGAGAHSFSGTQRWANTHDAAAYVSAIESGRLPVEQLETVTEKMALEEELFLGLRQLQGIDVGRIEREYGVTLGGKFEPLAAAGLVERAGDIVRLAEEKLSISNEVFVELMK
jgi:oxygen-independent coproporphyrinogen-3 oxidase